MPESRRDGDRPALPGVVRAYDEDVRERAVTLLRAGELVAIPTETVYGLGADATNGRACARIFEAKGRPAFNPLIAHCADLAMAEAHGIFTAQAQRLAATFWPGGLTLVVARAPQSGISDLVTARLATIALRVPKAPIMHALIERLGRPIAAPSANLSGHVSATTAAAVVYDLGSRVALVIDAGPSPLGLESTIVDLSGDAPMLLRPGAVPREEIEAVLGQELGRPRGDPDRPAAPGMLSAHYAPSCPLRLEAREVGPGEGLLAFGPAPVTGGKRAAAVINLSPAGDLREAAANLFSALRALDEAGVTAIAVAPVPDQGLGEAINDRLRRAVLGRSVGP